MNGPSPFDEIFAAPDPYGLLAGRNSGPARSTEDDIVLGNFAAINAFIDAHGYLPGSTSGGREASLQEYTLEAHLDAFRASDAYHALLAPHDRHGLLGVIAPATPNTMADLIASDDPLLKTPAQEIFTLRHVSAPIEKIAPDEIARRRQSPEFAVFRPIFAQLASDLASGRATTKRFEREGSIQQGAAFILNGIVAYVAEVHEPHRRGREMDARLRVIFDNGTESNHLLRSFARKLYEDQVGRQILNVAPDATGPLFSGEPEGEERITGSIYVVESLSTEPAIAALRGRLFKVGFTRGPVADRLADVSADPTFLLAPVKVAAVFDTVNLEPRKLERLLHQFFGAAQLRIDVLLGRTINPREWFVVPLPLVREAINRIIDGSIIHHRYDQLSQKIAPR